ncbi:hypothetical protein U1Q18_047569 [Sarracenia purpurea var. burkii]
MSQDQKFDQRWEFRRGEDDLYSSSNDTISSSGGEPVPKKDKLVSHMMILPENAATKGTPLSQQESQLDPHMGIPFESGKADKKPIDPSNKKYAVKNKMKRGSMKKSNRKKNRGSMHEPISLDDFKIFMKSMIEELKVARENMFTWMREELKKLVALELASRPTMKEGSCVQKVGQGQFQNNVELGVKTKSCNGGSLERSVKSERTTDSSNGYEVLDKQVNPDQRAGTITSREEEKVKKSRLSVKKPIFSSNLSGHVVSSPYLTIPTVLSEPQAENHRLDPSCKYTQPGAVEDKTDMNLGRAKLLIDASTRRGYFTGIQMTEHSASSSQMGSQNVSYLNQQNTQTSTMGTGFPVPLHQGLGNVFNIPSQAMENSSQGNNNILGLRLNGAAIRFSRGSHALSDHFVPSNIRSQMNYKTDAGLLAFGNQDLKDGHLYPN